ncbi:MAG TPA: polyphenol oxidase family protein [Candidatus Krumholzibacterium sp.]|nr:polyphenol oxidase family protein [Candidatus Krumholzibacterium sp.]
MYWENMSGLALGGFPSLEVMAPAMEARFASRLGGRSTGPFRWLNLGSGIGDDEAAVDDNRKLLLSALGLDPGAVALCRQVHGDRIEVVDSGGLYDSCDGLVTSRPGLSLVISTADCFPVLIYSPPERVLAALHVGREGARKGIIGKAVRILLERFDVDPSTLVAGTGPGICEGCYEVGSEIAGRFPEDVSVEREGRYHLDLAGFCEREFTLAGIRRDRIFRANLCTSCSEDLCYSYRRDGGTTGRHWTVAAVRG